MHTGVLRQACEGDRLGVEPAPVAEANEDQIAHAGRHEAGQEDRDRRGAKPIAPSIISTPPTIGPPKRAEIAANEPALPSTALSCAPSRARRVTRMPTIAPSAISGPSGPSTAPKESVPIAASAMPGA